MRRAASWAHLKEYFLAAEDYKQALVFEPRNQDCLLELEKCLIQIDKLCQHRLQLDPDNDALRAASLQAKEDLRKLRKREREREREKVKERW